MIRRNHMVFSVPTMLGLRSLNSYKSATLPGVKTALQSIANWKYRQLSLAISEVPYPAAPLPIVFEPLRPDFTQKQEVPIPGFFYLPLETLP